MFDLIINWIKGVINKMFSKTSIENALKIDVAISEKMVEAIELWSKIYENKASWINKDVKSLNLGSQIATETARMVTIEFKSEVTGSIRAEYINNIYKKFKENIMQIVEFGNAKGGIILKPYVKNNKIYIDSVHANSFVPTSYDDEGNINAGVFITQKIEGNKIYTKLEYHQFINNIYTILNKAYKSMDNKVLGIEINLSSIKEWEKISPETTILNIEKPLFSYYKVPQANNIDSGSPLGVSIYSRAIEQIKDADIQYGRLMWEYEASEKAVYADSSALKAKSVKNSKGETVYVTPKLKDRLFKSIDVGTDEFFKDYSPEIRDESFIRGLNKIKQEIEFKCGLAYGTISDPQAIEKSATEIKISKQRSYVTISNMQKSLQNTLEHLIYIIDVLCTLYNLAPKGKYEVSYEWDDSIIVDTETETTIRSGEVTKGLMSKKRYLMWRYGVTEEQAQEIIDEIKEEQSADSNDIFNNK